MTQEKINRKADQPGETAPKQLSWLGRHAFLMASILMFAACLCFNTVKLADAANPAESAYAYPGILMLLLGIVDLLFLHFSWLANPLLVLAWLATVWKKPMLAAGFAWAALLFALLFLTTPDLMVDEAENTKKIVGYGAGYWLWLLSIAMAFVASTGSRRGKSAPTPRDPKQ